MRRTCPSQTQCYHFHSINNVMGARVHLLLQKQPKPFKTSQSMFQRCIWVFVHHIPRVVYKSLLFRYPLGVNVMNGQLIEWTTSNLRDMFMNWESQCWPFHVLVKVVQCIMELMILYYFPLLTWTKKALHSM